MADGLHLASREGCAKPSRWASSACTKRMVLSPSGPASPGPRPHSASGFASVANPSVFASSTAGSLSPVLPLLRSRRRSGAGVVRAHRHHHPSGATPHWQEIAMSIILAALDSSAAARPVLEGPVDPSLIAAMAAPGVIAAVFGARATPSGRRPVGRTARASSSRRTSRWWSWPLRPSPPVSFGACCCLSKVQKCPLSRCSSDCCRCWWPTSSLWCSTYSLTRHCRSCWTAWARPGDLGKGVPHPPLPPCEPGRAANRLGRHMGG